MRKLSLVILTLLGLLTALAGSAPAADFGDAPDGGPTGYPGLFAQVGQFPTLAASGGLVIDDVNQARLGPDVSDEQSAQDPNDPDGRPNLDPDTGAPSGDLDDGLVNFAITLLAIPPPTLMTVNVSAPAGSAGGLFYINALIDQNLDGRWGGVQQPGLVEWVVRNFPVQLAPGESKDVQLPPFAFGFGNRLPDGAWMRIALTDEMVRDVDWNGGGTFNAGEVEDHVIRLPQVCSCIPRLSFPRRVNIPQGALGVFFVGRLRNIGATTCDVTYDLRRVIGGVNILALGQTCAPGFGPLISCSRAALAPAAPPGTPLLFFALRGALPSRFTYRAAGNDPPAIITPDGVMLGFDDSIGDVDFQEVPMEINKVIVEIYGKYVLLHLWVGGKQVPDIGVVLSPEESFRGLSYEEAMEHGNGPMELPN